MTSSARRFSSSSCTFSGFSFDPVRWLAVIALIHVGIDVGKLVLSAVWKTSGGFGLLNSRLHPAMPQSSANSRPVSLRVASVMPSLQPEFEHHVDPDRLTIVGGMVMLVQLHHLDRKSVV